MEIRLKAFKETLEQIEGEIKKRQSGTLPTLGTRYRTTKKHTKTHTT
jgi:hypothetical protein